MQTLQINNKVYHVQLAVTEQEKEQGLSNTESLTENSGMLFDYSENPQSELTFNTIDMNYPIDIIFINSDDEVIAVELGEPKSEELIECVCDDDELIKYVLEVNSNSGIKIGDELEFDDVEEDEIDKMYVLDPEGNSQMTLVGGERIVSRIETRELIRKAKKANKSKKDIDYKKLGKYMIKVLDGQNNRPEEFVDGPNNQDIEMKKGE